MTMIYSVEPSDLQSNEEFRSIVLGDTPESIANEEGVSANWLLRRNHAKELQTGNLIVVPMDDTGAKKNHVKLTKVQLSEIQKRDNDLEQQDAVRRKALLDKIKRGHPNGDYDMIINWDFNSHNGKLYIRSGLKWYSASGHMSVVLEKAKGLIKKKEWITVLKASKESVIENGEYFPDVLMNLFDELNPTIFIDDKDEVKLPEKVDALFDDRINFSAVIEEIQSQGK